MTRAADALESAWYPLSLSPDSERRLRRCGGKVDEDLGGGLNGCLACCHATSAHGALPVVKLAFASSIGVTTLQSCSRPGGAGCRRPEYRPKGVEQHE